MDAYYIACETMPDDWAFRRKTDEEARRDAPGLAMENVKSEGASEMDIGESYDYEWFLYKIPEGDYHDMEKDWWAGGGSHGEGIQLSYGVICANRTQSGIQAKHCT